MDGRRDLLALASTVVLLVAWNLGRSCLEERFTTPANLIVGIGIGGIGVLGGLGWDGLGLRRRTALRGVAYGGVAFGAVLVVLVVAGAIPATSGALHDNRVHVDASHMLFEVLVAIPLGTVVLEELAFRGVLLGLLRGRCSTAAAVTVCSVLFGMWHIKGVLHNDTGGIAIGAIVGTMAATTAAGIAFVWLRIRSDSLLAPVLGHIATNSLAFAVAWAYWYR